MLKRGLALLAALIGWAGLGLQLGILITGPLGPVGGAWRFLAFFTVLMNLLATCLFTRAAVAPDFSPAGARLQTASTVYMTLVGSTYVLVLEKLWDPRGLALLADRLLHYAAPAAALIFWIVCVPKSGLRWSDALRWTGLPLLYLVYALARGGSDGFYPYFFIDVDRLGWRRVLMNSTGMLVAFIVLSAVLIAIGKATSREPAAAPTA